MPKSVTIPADVGAVLARATVDGSTIKLPDGQLERPLYAAVDKVLKAMGGKWNRSAGGHVFAGTLPPDLAAALSAGHVVDRKKAFEQFFTPEDLAGKMCDLAGVKPFDKVLEPSAGDGRIVAALLARGAHVLAIEIDEGHADALREMKAAAADMRTGTMHVEQGDFLTMPVDEMGWVGMPAAAVMNPPFSNGQDVTHVRRAFDMLAPGGKLVAIMSPHWTFATDRKSVEFREWTKIDGLPQFSLGVTTYPRTDIQEARVCHLPARTFAESGTNVATVLLTMTKAS